MNEDFALRDETGHQLLKCQTFHDAVLLEIDGGTTEDGRVIIGSVEMSLEDAHRLGKFLSDLRAEDLTARVSPT